MKFLLPLCLLVAGITFVFAQSDDAALAECLKKADACCAKTPVCARLGCVDRCQYFLTECDMKRENCERTPGSLQFHKVEDIRCVGMPQNALLPCGYPDPDTN